MTVQEVEAVRDNFATDKNGNVSPAWRKSFPEQGRKTVLHRLLKRLPMNPVLAELYGSSDIADGYDLQPRKIQRKNNMGDFRSSVGNLLGESVATPQTEPEPIVSSPERDPDTGQIIPEDAGRAKQ